MCKYKADYLGVHKPRYDLIANDCSSGWSSPESARATFLYFSKGLAMEGVPSKGSLLELGCGDGCLTTILASETDFQVSGIDIVPKAIDLAKKRAASIGGTIDFRVGNVLDLPWNDHSFDVLIDGDCLHCIVLNDRISFFTEAKRVLKPHGFLFIFTLIGEPKNLCGGYFDPKSRCYIINGIAGRHFGTTESITSEVVEAGFTPIHSETWHPVQPDENDQLFLIAKLSG